MKSLMAIVLTMTSMFAFADSEQAMELNVNCDQLETFSRIAGNTLMDLDGAALGVRYRDWTQDMVTQASNKATICANKEWQANIDRWASLARVTPGLDATPPKSVYDKIYARLENEVQSLANVLNQAQILKQAEEKKRLVDICKATNDHKRFQIQERVIDDVAQIAGYKKLLEQQKRYAEASGVRNLSLERTYGEMFVNSQDFLKRDFATYQQMGGPAKTPQGVTHQLTNPCEE